jgi:predicted amidohydrolase
MITRCIENNIFAVTANRFGSDKRPQGQLRFTGKSQIVAPKGKVIHRAFAQREEIFVVDIDLDLARDKKITALNNVISDRRPHYYLQLCK